MLSWLRCKHTKLAGLYPALLSAGVSRHCDTSQTPRTPGLLQAATGEDVTAEELGGAELHCSKSGKNTGLLAVAFPNSASPLSLLPQRECSTAA